MLITALINVKQHLYKLLNNVYINTLININNMSKLL